MTLRTLKSKTTDIVAAFQTLFCLLWYMRK